MVEALLGVDLRRFALDGELLATRDGRPDFAALLARIHPAASRVERLRRETAASLVAFKLLALGGDDLRDALFAERRRLLERLLDGAAPPVYPTPLTDDPAVAEAWLERFQGRGLDGVVATHRELRYEPGARADGEGQARADGGLRRRRLPLGARAPVGERLPAPGGVTGGSRAPPAAGRRRWSSTGCRCGSSASARSPTTSSTTPGSVSRRGSFAGGWIAIPAHAASTSSTRPRPTSDEGSLVWLANQGTVELHPFPFRLSAPERPLALVLDLDPGPPAGLDACRALALLLRERLDGARVKASGRAGCTSSRPRRRRSPR